MKLLYVHGYMGNGNGSASRRIKEVLDRRGIEYSLDAPQFSVTEPEEMLSMLNSLVKEKQYEYVVASSLGAFYSAQLQGPKKILVNPALPEILLKIRDADPESNPKLTDSLLTRLRKIQNDFYLQDLDHELRSETYFIFGNQDVIAGNEEFFGKCYGFEKDCDSGHVLRLDMEHKLSDAGAEKVCEMIEKIEAEGK